MCRILGHSRAQVKNQRGDLQKGASFCDGGHFSAILFFDDGFLLRLETFKEAIALPRWPGGGTANSLTVIANFTSAEPWRFTMEK